MKEKNPWILPAGVAELLPEQADCLEYLRRSILDQYFVWGYNLVFPPLIEYIESLAVGAGHEAMLQTFRITDQLSGRQLGLRADMTPQVARIDARQVECQGVNRLCYCGSVLRARPDHLLAKRTLVQTGVELFGHSSLAAEFEVLGLLLKTLQLSGLDTVLLDIGHAGMIEKLIQRLALEGQDRLDFLAILARKSQTEMQAFANERVGEAKNRTLCLLLLELHGPCPILERAEAELLPLVPEVSSELKALQAIAEYLQQQLQEKYLYFDLGEPRGLQYHTGLVFSAYTPGRGQEIAKGGRYDKIGEIFGSARSAVGFSLDLLQLVQLNAQGRLGQKSIYAPSERDFGLLEMITQLRQLGERVIVSLNEENEDPIDMGCDRKITKSKTGHWSIELL